MEANDAIRTAAKVAGRALGLKAAAIGAVLFIIFLLIVGLFGAGMGGKAFADSCGGRGQPGADLGDVGTPQQGQAPGAQMRKDQIANAKIIDQVASAGGLSGRATFLALVTALQESTLLNLDHGDRDSVGLFQQRPSSGWGTKEQIMDPKYAAGMFFFGDKKDHDPPGLVDVKGWESMDIKTIVRKVQRPDDRYLDLYLGQQDAAHQIAQEASINLDRPGQGGQDTGATAAGTGTPDDDKGGATTGPNDNGECFQDAEGKPSNGKPGAPFHDSTAPWPSEVTNPRSTADAIQWARNQATTGGRDWYRACLAFVARTYGWSFSGTTYAIDHYREMPPAFKHDKDRNPPPGALMYWETSQRAGHVAVYLGGGKIASNDILRPGYIDVVDATAIEANWGATYAGWAPPYFPKGG
ncbi:C40 family peptidase [Streptomyces violascens]|uniref:peptidase M23 n=1 Tax=Streptomyces violascens TaxID=67381 RepID=UPI0036CDC64F